MLFVQNKKILDAHVCVCTFWLQVLNAVHCFIIFSFFEHLFWDTLQFPTSFFIHNMVKQLNVWEGK